jgi:hypothetical protein
MTACASTDESRDDVESCGGVDAGVDGAELAARACAAAVDDEAADGIAPDVEAVELGHR